MKKYLVVLLLVLSLAAVPLIHALAVDVIWADGLVTLDTDLEDDIATLLETTPPDGSDGVIYAATYISGVDGDWNVSIINLVDVSAPYDDWNAETNGVWAGTVICSGTDPDWICDYMETPAAGGSSGMILPWQSGYSAIYGTRGVHRDTNSIVAGSYAVDFVGNGASDSMPANVVAVADGTITWVCSDGTSMAIKVAGGPVDIAYFHFAPGQVFVNGDTVRQGEVLGQLKYGTFTGSGCGWGSQSASEYHLHFVFLPTTGSYLEIGNCVLTISTQVFVCAGNSYGPLSRIPNGGASSSLDDLGTDTGTGSNAALGGARLWDGVLTGLTSMLDGITEDFTLHTSIGLEGVVTDSMLYLTDLYNMVAGLQLFYMVPVFVIGGLVLALEATRWLLAAIRWILQFVPTMG
jgi:hypothetical protein